MTNCFSTQLDTLSLALRFEMNKIKQMNCHVLFKQVYTMLCICTFKKKKKKKCVARSDGWMDEFGVLRLFQQNFSHIGTMEGEHERLCAVKCLISSGRISPQGGFEPGATR